MPLAEILPTDSGDEAFAKVNAAIDAINALATSTDQTTLNLESGINANTAAIETKAATTDVNAATGAIESLEDALSTQLAGLQTQQQADEQKIAGLQGQVPALSGSVSSLALQVAGQGVLGNAVAAAILAPPDKIGDNPFLFTPDLAGAAAAVPPLPPDGVVVTALGTVYQAGGAQVIAARPVVWAEPSRVLAVRFGYLRTLAPTDPSNDAIQCGIAWLDQNGNVIGQTVANTATQPQVSAGLTVVACRVPSQPGDPVAITPPAGCVGWRPYIQAFGLDAVTQFVSISTVDITDAAAYSPNLAALSARVTALEGEVASLNPLAAGIANGLATLDSTGNVIQLPMLKAGFITAADALVPGAEGILDQAFIMQTSVALSVSHHKNPYFRAGDPWVTFAQATLGLSAAQVATILTGIGTPAQRAGTTLPTVVYDLDIATASVLRAARAAFAGVTGASMKSFYATSIGDQDSDSYYLATVEPHAPVNGGLYGLLNTYLTTASPNGPGLSSAAASALLTTIWANALTIQP